LALVFFRVLAADEALLEFLAVAGVDAIAPPLILNKGQSDKTVLVAIQLNRRFLLGLEK